MATTKNITLQYPPIKNKVLSGPYLDPAFRDWLVQVYNVLGGAYSQSNSNLQDNINTNSTEITDLRDNININSNNISTLNSEIETANKDIQSLENENTTNVQNILATTKAIDSLTKSLSNLNTEVTNLSNSINNIHQFEVVESLPSSGNYAQKFCMINSTSEMYFSKNGYTWYKIFPAN